MTQLPLITPEGGNDNTPLPLIVANRWNFPLAHIQTDDGMFYAVQDWMRGLLGRDARNILAMMRRSNPQFSLSIKMLSYRSTDNKIYQRPYIDENRLIWLTVRTRLTRGKNRLADIRNFIADFAPEYQYMRCASVEDKGLTEIEFQTALVTALKPSLPDYEVHEFYSTSAGHFIDIIAVKKYEDNGDNFACLLIECKAKREEFYKAVGQVICYSAEISGSPNTANLLLAIAMPYEIIDDYVLNMAMTLSIRLISIVDNLAIDAITGEPFSL
jgi:hypothetical protein